MKISVNDKELFTLSEIQKKVICNDIHEDVFDEDMQRRIKYIIYDKYKQCFKRLKQEWDSKLIENKIEMVPTDADAYAELVFSQPNYKCRKQRDMEKSQI